MCIRDSGINAEYGVLHRNHTVLGGNPMPPIWTGACSLCCSMCCRLARCQIRPSFWRRKSFWVVVLVWLATLLGIHLSYSGVSVLPKCRYGERGCYFKVRVCFPGDSKHAAACRDELRQRSIEGSSDHPIGGSEQLAIPFLAVIVSCVPPLLGAATVMMKRSIGLLDAGKHILAVTMCLLCLGIDVLQRKTFDCRWWHDSHHGNAARCQRGLALYVCGTLLIILSEIGLLVLFTRMYEHELKELKQMQVSCLTNSGMSAIKQEKFQQAIEFCSRAIALDPICANAYFRRAVAHFKLSNTISAIDDLETALTFQPGNAAIRHELQRCQADLKHEGCDELDSMEIEDVSDEEEAEDEECDEQPLLQVKRVRFADHESELFD
eukprot:TRINITY_DN28865_c0_g1_i1.p1 TRINITY_DN28865_c0_g1~~TRINITY_DN28865_c0_g1_i1.p1  ORF type:complete len:379 (+),score=50.88 TRINITY_DN28865_c0_g1_i1:133-1269(+)